MSTDSTAHPQAHPQAHPHSEPPTASLADEAIHHFLIFYRYLRQYARQIDEQGMRPREFSVLRFLWENGAATVGQVQSYLYCSASVASTVIAGLEEKGLVTRTRSSEDNRVVIVELTPMGQERAVDTPLGGIVLLRRRLQTLPAERLAVINQALVELMDLMEVTENE
jgi:DNA-binding MarR family transcriptional regulator